MANTPIPRTATEMAVRPCSDMEEYTLSPEALEEIRKKYPKPENAKRPKAPIEIKPGGAKVMAKDGPDSGVTKQMLLEALAAGKTVRDIENEHGMKQNTMAYWVKKWGLDGISRDQAKAMLMNKVDGSVLSATSGKIGETEVHKQEQRIQELTNQRDQLISQNRDLNASVISNKDRAYEAEQRERVANAKVGEYLQAIQELQERIRELEAAEPPSLPPIAELVPKKATELQRIDGIIEDLSRARWILERVAT